MRRREIAGVLVGVAIMAFAGCGEDDGGPVSAPSFDAVLPSGWSEGDDDDLESIEETAVQGAASAIGVSSDDLVLEAEAVWFDSETGGSFATNVNVLAEELPAGFDEGDYVDASLGNLEGLPGIEDFERGPGPDLGGDKTEEVEYSSSAGTGPVRFRALTVVRGETGFTVTLAAAEEDFGEASADLDEIAASWEWTD